MLDVAAVLDVITVPELLLSMEAMDVLVDVDVDVVVEDVDAPVLVELLVVVPPVAGFCAVGVLSPPAVPPAVPPAAGVLMVPSAFLSPQLTVGAGTLQKSV